MISRVLLEYRLCLAISIRLCLLMTFHRHIGFIFFEIVFLDVVKQFFAEIINLFAVTSKIFRTENALEFVQTDLQNYYATLGVLYQTTYFHTSQ